MLFTKMNAIIDEVNLEIAEREELTECIAICLIARKNLFILGDTGQAKSYAINEFRKRITGAKQFERLMSKQTDEEQIFGRLDLSSLIPGNLPQSELAKETPYKELLDNLSSSYDKYKADGQNSTLEETTAAAKRLTYLKHIICALNSGTPQMITDGKIPDSHIVFLDEIFKSNDGILNSLLTALNEKVYTNEGQTVDIPVISFFSASNEIPNFNDSTQAILKPLYDRFELKVLTEYVQEKENRIKVLEKKQGKTPKAAKTCITLDELYEMQDKAAKIPVPDAINELMDNLLCALRRNGIHVSDRKFFGFTPIVQAKAYLNGNSEVTPKDLMVLKNYFWNTPAEIPTVGKILSDVCENPIGTEIGKLISMANESLTVMEETAASLIEEQAEQTELLKPNVVFSKELLRIYKDLINLKSDDISEEDDAEIDNAEKEMNEMLKKAAELTHAPFVPLAERVALEF